MKKVNKIEFCSKDYLNKKAKVTIYDSVFCQNGFGNPPQKAKDFIAWLKSMIEKAPPQLRDEVVIERWDDGYRAGYEVSYVRNLTALEQEEFEVERRLTQKTLEIKQLKQLLSKYKDQL